MKLSDFEARLKAEFGPMIDQAVESIKEEQEKLRTKQEELAAQQTDFMSRITAEAGTSKEEDLKPGFQMARMIRSLVVGRGNLDRSVNYATETWGTESAITKGLVTGIGADGGFLVPEEFSAEMIELLRARSVVRAMNPRVLPMASGVLTISRITGGATSSYGGEATAQNASQEEFDALRLVWKKLKTIVPISNELAQFSTPSADEVVRDDTVASMATREDIAFIRDDGTLGTPIGIRHWAAAANVTASAAADDGTDPTLGEVETDLRVSLGHLEDNDVRMLNVGWLMSPRSKNYMMTLRGAQDALAFPELRTANPTLLS